MLACRVDVGLQVTGSTLKPQYAMYVQSLLIRFSIAMPTLTNYCVLLYCLTRSDTVVARAMTVSYEA